MNIRDLLSKVLIKKDITQAESEELLIALMKVQVTSVHTADVLTSLRMKGEGVNEIVEFINVMREKMLRIKSPVGSVDVCGTGGDGSNTFNISTTVAFVVASAGVPVAKHG